MPRLFVFSAVCSLHYKQCCDKHIEDGPSDERVQRCPVRTRIITALVGAFGFGVEADRIASNYLKHGTGVVDHILLGVIFLLLAIVNSHFVLPQIRKTDRP